MELEEVKEGQHPAVIFTIQAATTRGHLPTGECLVS